jgi:predicted RNase H-like HicB family nuclease
MTEYLVVYEMGECGEWGAHVPDLPGCVAVGATKAEVERLMREAMPAHVALMRESGDPVPEPHHLAGVISA